jgi:isopenicillin N synthase-like dioxygenase
MSVIPVLDLQDYLSNDPQRKQKFIQGFGKAYEEIGFAAIENHGIPSELTDRFYKAIQQFFAMPTADKLKYEIVELAGQRGYTSFW